MLGCLASALLSPVASFSVSHLIDRSERVLSHWGIHLIRMGLVIGFIVIHGTTDNHMERMTGWFFLFCLAVATVTDVCFRLIPDRLTVTAGILFMSGRLIWGEEPAQLYFMGFLFGGGLLWSVAWFSQGGMGGGDVKLAALAGWALGWPDIAVGMALSVFIGGMVALVLWISRRVRMGTSLPFGPFLAVGMGVAWIAGERILDWYLSFFP